MKPIILVAAVLTTLAVLLYPNKSSYRSPETSSTSTKVLIEIQETPKQGVEMTITAYSEYDSCHYENCLMANGQRAYVGAVACPRRIKMGSTVFLEGLGYFVCSDRYNANLSDRIDIFMGYGQEAHEKALNFGKQSMTILTDLIPN